MNASQEHKTSKYHIIQRALADNPGVVVMDLGVPYTPMYHNFIVAPKQGLYTADELQEFMLGLVPLAPTEKADFIMWDAGSKSWFTRSLNKRLRFGNLQFSETEGQAYYCPFCRPYWLVSPYPDVAYAKKVSLKDTDPRAGMSSTQVALIVLREFQRKNAKLQRANATRALQSGGLLGLLGRLREK